MRVCACARLCFSTGTAATVPRWPPPAISIRPCASLPAAPLAVVLFPIPAARRRALCGVRLNIGDVCDEEASRKGS